MWAGGIHTPTELSPPKLHSVLFCSISSLNMCVRSKVFYLVYTFILFVLGNIINSVLKSNMFLIIHCRGYAINTQFLRDCKLRHVIPSAKVFSYKVFNHLYLMIVVLFSFVLHFLTLGLIAVLISVDYRRTHVQSLPYAADYHFSRFQSAAQP